MKITTNKSTINILAPDFKHGNGKCKNGCSFCEPKQPTHKFVKDKGYPKACKVCERVKDNPIHSLDKEECKCGQCQMNKYGGVSGNVAHTPPQTDKTTGWENRVTELAENIFMGGCVAKTEYDKLGASNARRAIKDLKQLIAELLKEEREENSNYIQRLHTEIARLQKAQALDAYKKEHKCFKDGYDYAVKGEKVAIKLALDVYRGKLMSILSKRKADKSWHFKDTEYGCHHCTRNKTIDEVLALIK